MVDAKTSVSDSTASATSAYVLPTNPATSFTIASAVLTRIADCAARIPRSSALKCRSLAKLGMTLPLGLGMTASARELLVCDAVRLVGVDAFAALQVFVIR